MEKYKKHPWLVKYPIQNNSTKLIIGTHPPKPYRGCMQYFIVVLHRLVDFKVNYFSLYFNISYGVFPLKEP